MNTRKETDLITFAIPIYNAENDVEKAVLSALSQTYQHIEYLLVDDRGTDNTMKIIERIIATHPRGKQVRIITHPSNIGIGAGRNTAIDHAKGKYLFFMDDDDEVTPDCIHKLYDEILKTDVDFVCGSHEEIRGKEITPRINNFIEKDKEQIVLSYFNINKFQSIATWNKLFKISFLRKNNIKCIPHQTSDDWYFTFQVLLNAQSYSTISDITYSYLYGHSAKNKTKQDYNSSYQQLIEISGNLLEYLQKSSLDDALKRKVKRKLFGLRLYMSRTALKQGYGDCINGFLNPAFLKDKDTLRSGWLLCAYIFSSMPFPVKKMGVLFIDAIKKS